MLEIIIMVLCCLAYNGELDPGKLMLPIIIILAAKFVLEFVLEIIRYRRKKSLREFNKTLDNYIKEWRKSNDK